MTRRGGFTVVELIITITIMAILLTLSVIGLRSTQANGRDEERKTDTANIARSLETIHPSIISNMFNTTESLVPQSGYPSTAFLASYLSETYNGTSSTTMFGGFKAGAFNKNDLQAPGVTGSTISLVMATNNSQTTAGVTPQPTTTTYIYQPIGSEGGASAGNLCTESIGLCRKFNLYYRLETDSSIQMITSKHQ